MTDKQLDPLSPAALALSGGKVVTPKWLLECITNEGSEGGFVKVPLAKIVALLEKNDRLLAAAEIQMGIADAIFRRLMDAVDEAIAKEEKSVPLDVVMEALRELVDAKRMLRSLLQVHQES
jgi:hypothetical protein